jgi:predicted transcriptional regulator
MRTSIKHAPIKDEDKIRSPITDVAEREIELLSRHIEVLKTVKTEGPIGIIRLSQITGQPQHMIRYSLRTLEKEGVIRPSMAGAVITDKLDETLELLEDRIDDLITKMTDLKKKLK